MPDPLPGIVLRDASFSVDGRTILHPLTLDLGERRIAIVGRNGSGKTTLLRLIAGLIAPDAGSVRIGGVDPARDRRAALRSVGILFQNPDRQIIFPTVIEEVAFGLRQLGATEAEARAAALAFLSAQGRAQWADRPVATLSHGQRQFLCLMSVLAMAPQTLLLDEPFAGLDLPTSAQLLRLLETLGQRVVIVTHDPHRLEGMARILWMEAGRLVGDGPPDKVLPAFRADMARRGASDADADLGG